MARYEFKLPDIGEGIAEAEIVAWHVKIGDEIAEDQQIADMMTDKATVEMESPVAGKVVELAGEVGDQVPMGWVLAVIETEGAARAAESVEDSKDERPLGDGAIEPTPEQAEEMPVVAVEETPEPPKPAPRVEPEVAEKEPVAKAHVLASPAVRARARALGLDRGPVEAASLGPWLRRAAQGRDDQGRRPAPQDRREYAGGEASNPALHTGRGI